MWQQQRKQNKTARAMNLRLNRLLCSTEPTQFKERHCKNEQKAFNKLPDVSRQRKMQLWPKDQGRTLPSR